MRIVFSITLYVLFWLSIAGVLIYKAIAAGYSVWFVAPLVYLLFFYVNGSLSYVLLRRKLRSEGEQPPSYLMYLISHLGLQDKVDVPRPLWVILGIVISLGGLFFIVLCGLMLSQSEFSQMPHPFGAVALFLVTLVLGVAISYVGFRLIVLKNDEKLFRGHQSTKLVRIEDSMKLNLKLLSAYLALPLFAGIFDFSFRNNQSIYLIYCTLLMITTVFIMFLWYWHDSRLVKFKRSPLLDIMIVGVSIISIPYYLYRTRGLKGGTIKSIVFLFLLLAYMILEIVGTYIGDNYISEDECAIHQEYDAEDMNNNLSLVFESISINDALRLLGDFIGYEVLRPNSFDWDQKIKTNFVNEKWKDVFQGVCRSNNLTCWIKDKTIYVLPHNHPDKKLYLKHICSAY